jgi:hypothetical protein
MMTPLCDASGVEVWRMCGRWWWLPRMCTWATCATTSGPTSVRIPSLMYSLVAPRTSPFAPSRTECFTLCGAAAVSAQNVAREGKAGAFTGELPAPILKDFGLTWVITGQSVR